MEVTNSMGVLSEVAMRISIKKAYSNAPKWCAKVDKMDFHQVFVIWQRLQKREAK